MSEKKELVSPDGKRLSGRNITDLREVKIKAGVLKRADGSALLQWGNNKVLAAVYGPKECFPKRLASPYRTRIIARYLMAPFSGAEEHGRSGPNRRSREISKVIEHVFENQVLTHLFPKTAIEIHIEVLQSDGGTRVAAVNAAAVALADAGIPMRDLACGVACGKADGHLILDLDKYEDNLGESDVPTILSPRTGEIILYQMDGMLTRDEISKAYDMVVEGSKSLHEIQVRALKEHYEEVASKINGE